MIGQRWFYIEAIRPSTPQGGPEYVIKSATINGETPRKWLLREDDAGEWSREKPPGEAFEDWSIPKKGSDVLEGSSTGRRLRYTKTFYASEDLARKGIRRLQEQRWAQAHAYGISKMVGRCDDATILRKVAELVGWKENQP